MFAQNRESALLSIGIDIGGTKILGALVDQSGQVVQEKRIASPAQDPERMIQEVAALIGELLVVEPEVAGIGVAAAGFIDADRSTVLYAPNLNWRNEPLRQKITEKVGREVVIENDANAAGWAEFRFGAAQQYGSMMMLTLGTGVGGAVVADGKLMRGGFGIGGELGHVTVVDGGHRCGCGRLGCVEQYSSGTALLRELRQIADDNTSAGQLLRELRGDGELTGHHAYQAYQAKDSATLEAIERAASYLAKAMGSLVAVLDPEVFVIGGGLSELGEGILEPIRRNFGSQLPAHGFRPEAEIVVASFANEAGVIGAADLARQAGQ